jgi:hypothetical protein
LIAAAVGDTTEACFSAFPCFSFVFGGCASVFAGFVQERFASSGFISKHVKKNQAEFVGVSPRDRAEMTHLQEHMKKVQTLDKNINMKFGHENILKNVKTDDNQEGKMRKMFWPVPVL